MKKMHGVITPMVTPFTSDNKIDLDAACALVDYLIAGGVHGLYPCGTTGEMLKMRTGERKEFAAEIVRHAAGRVPVFIQTGAATTEDAVELARHAYEIGSDGIGVVSPQFFSVNDREMVEYYVQVASAVPADFPVYLYGIPQCAANDIKPEVADLIVKRAPNVVGIKYSYTDFVRLKDYLLCGNGNFDVLFGPDRLILPALSMGCRGTVAGCSQCCPAPFVSIYESYMRGAYASALESSRIATELCEIVGAGANIAYFKSALRINGVIDCHMRAPALDLTADEEDDLRRKLEAYKEKYGY